MLATFAIEIALAIYVLVRYKMTPLTRIVAATLILLATFQLAEYKVCGSTNIGIWPKVGFAAITLLPISGLIQVYVLAKRRFDAIIWLALTTAALVMAGFIFWPTLTSAECSGNYAIFHTNSVVAMWLYIVYYFGWLLTGMIMVVRLSNGAPKNVKRALKMQNIGYLIFILPTAVTVALHPRAVDGTPSIMCGFAVLYALIITFGILPAIQKHKV